MEYLTGGVSQAPLSVCANNRFCRAGKVSPSCKVNHYAAVGFNNHLSGLTCESTIGSPPVFLGLEGQRFLSNGLPKDIQYFDLEKAIRSIAFLRCIFSPPSNFLVINFDLKIATRSAE